MKRPERRHGAPSCATAEVPGPRVRLSDGLGGRLLLSSCAVPAARSATGDHVPVGRIHRLFAAAPPAQPFNPGAQPERTSP